jgi:TonB family protein
MPRIPLVGLAMALMLGAQDDQTYKITDQGVTKALLIHKVEPKYSKKAKKNKIEGAVKLKVVIGADGIAKDFQVEKSLDPDLDTNAIGAVKQWRFKPSYQGWQTCRCLRDHRSPVSSDLIPSAC